MKFMIVAALAITPLLAVDKESDEAVAGVRGGILRGHGDPG